MYWLDGRIGDLGNYPLSETPKGRRRDGGDFSNPRFTPLEEETGRESEGGSLRSFQESPSLHPTVPVPPAVTVTVTMVLSWQDHLVASCSLLVSFLFPPLFLNVTKLNTHTNILFLVFYLSMRHRYTHTHIHRLNSGMLGGNKRWRQKISEEGQVEFKVATLIRFRHRGREQRKEGLI